MEKEDFEIEFIIILEKEEDDVKVFYDLKPKCSDTTPEMMLKVYKELVKLNKIIAKDGEKHITDLTTAFNKKMKRGDPSFQVSILINTCCSEEEIRTKIKEFVESICKGTL